jgi:hypothetical protein
MQYLRHNVLPRQLGKAERVRTDLRVRGWARFDASDLQLTPAEEKDARDLVKYTRTLPLDRFGGGGRFRSFAQGILSPKTASVAWKPGSPGHDGSLEIDYWQGADYQPEHGGVVRLFRRATDEVMARALLNKLIWWDLWLTGMAETNEALLCGVHFVRMNATPGCPSMATPDCLHRDGEPFTIVHLLERQDVDGGVNHIAPPQYASCQIRDVPQCDLISFSLDEPLQSYIVDDAAVCHHVTAVTCNEAASLGTRTAILIEFSSLPIAMV